MVGDIGNTAGVAPATGGFAVNAQGTPDNTVAITAGVAYVQGTPTSQNAQTFRVKNTANTNLTISANSSGSTKYDWVYIKLDATNLNTPNTAGDDVATIVASRSSSSSADDGTPPTYGYPIAVVTVANGFSTITNSNIRDIRGEAGMTPTPVTVSTESWTSAGMTPTSIACNGNRSYSITWPASIIANKSVEMRNKYTRTVTAPTQCADLESGSSQYFNRASGSLTGVTFTDDFVVSAWVKLESYGTTIVASRWNGTSGWYFYVGATGQVYLVGTNASAANFSQVNSYQSVPLQKWVHITAQLDMSAFTATTTTSYVMIDGVDVPAAVSRGGTNPTALVQAGNLEIGAYNGGTSPFDGKIAQVAIYSAKVTQANIRATISQGLTGSETSLISAYSLNGVLTDLNANANTLTAQGSAAATATDSPFAGGDTLYNTDGTTEFSITTAISSDGLTETVQVPEGYAIPTTGGVSAVSYSTQKTPYGFPNNRGKWTVLVPVFAAISAPNTTAATTTNPGGLRIDVPIGAWNLGYSIGYGVTPNAAIPDLHVGLQTSNTAFVAGEQDMTNRLITHAAASSNFTQFDAKASKFVELTSATPYYILVRNETNMSSNQIRANVSTTIPETSSIYAELSLL